MCFVLIEARYFYGDGVQVEAPEISCTSTGNLKINSTNGDSSKCLFKIDSTLLQDELIMISDEHGFNYTLPIQIWIPENIEFGLSQTSLHKINNSCGLYQKSEIFF